MLKIVKPVLDKLDSFLAPVKPVVLALGKEVPVYSDISKRFGGDPKTWLDLISDYSDDPDVDQQVEDAKKVVAILKDLISLSNRAQSLANSAGIIQFGSYRFRPAWIFARRRSRHTRSAQQRHAHGRICEVV